MSSVRGQRGEHVWCRGGLFLILTQSDERKKCMKKIMGKCIFPTPNVGVRMSWETITANKKREMFPNACNGGHEAFEAKNKGMADHPAVRRRQRRGRNAKKFRS